MNAPRPTPNRLRAIPRVARCACGEVVIASELHPGELTWCRECRSFVDEVVRASNSRLTVVALPPQGLDLAAHIETVEMCLIEQALARAGSIHAAAPLLGLKRTTLSEKIRRYSSSDPRFAAFRGKWPYRPGAAQ